MLRTHAPPLRRARVALLAATLAGPALAACTGGDGASTTTTGAPVEDVAASQFLAYPETWATPIEVPIGQRFALMLGAEPSDGYHWEVAQQADPAVALPLGSQFLARDSEAIVTSTIPPPPPPPPPPPDDDATASSTTTTSTTSIAADGAETTTTEAPTTTTTEPPSMVQVLSYVATRPGTTTVTFRYTRVGQAPGEGDRVVTFTITVPDPFAPPPPPPEDQGQGGQGGAQP